MRYIGAIILDLYFLIQFLYFMKSRKKSLKTNLF